MSTLDVIARRRGTARRAPAKAWHPRKDQDRTMFCPYRSTVPLYWQGGTTGLPSLDGRGQGWVTPSP